MSDNLFSIIIPTMWKSKHLVKMLDLYQKSKYVYEIILIDNDPKNKLESFIHRMNSLGFKYIIGKNILLVAKKVNS